MTRLSTWGNNFKINYPDDILILRSLIPELKDISDSQIQEMYAFWSEAHYSAGWHMIFDGIAEQFRDWLLTDLTEPDILW